MNIFYILLSLLVASLTNCLPSKVFRCPTDVYPDFYPLSTSLTSRNIIVLFGVAELELF